MANTEKTAPPEQKQTETAPPPIEEITRVRIEGERIYLKELKRVRALAPRMLNLRRDITL